MAKTQTALGPVLQVRDMTAGVNLRPTSTNIKPNEARRLLNTLIASPGEIGPYPGWASFSTASLGARRLQGARRIYLAGSTFTLGADNGSIYLPADNGVWGAAVSTGWSASADIDFPYDRDLVAIFDSTTAPKKSTDGSTWTKFGIAAPTVAPTAAAVGGGSLVLGNTYEFSYAYQDDALSAYGNESATVQQATAGANLTVRVGVTASADAQVDTIRLYARDVTAGETVRRYYASYTNTTTTHDVTSNSWSATAEAPTDHTLPEIMSFAVVWKNRWWGAMQPSPTGCASARSSRTSRGPRPST